MTTINNQQQIINPHMKFTPSPTGVIHTPPAIYQYSLQEEVRTGETQYRQILRSLNRNRLARISEKHPNLKSNILSVFRFTLAVTIGGLAIRYRHSLPLLKNICQKSKKTPPSFFNDLEKIWQSIVKK